MIDSLALLVIELGVCMGGNLTLLLHHTITTAMECHQHEMAALLRYFGFPFGKVGRSVSISIHFCQWYEWMPAKCKNNHIYLDQNAVKLKKQNLRKNMNYFYFFTTYYIMHFVMHVCDK